jgi:hypothetical protein
VMDSVVLLIVLVVGFGAGHGVRDFLSRRRRAHVLAQ